VLFLSTLRLQQCRWLAPTRTLWIESDAEGSLPNKPGARRFPADNPSQSALDNYSLHCVDFTPMTEILFKGGEL
jgi:hypothetical protein